MTSQFNNQHSSAKTKIKNKRTVLLPLIVLLFIAVFSLTKINKVQAACAAPATDFGAATKVMNVPNAGTYRIWSRIMAPNATANSYNLEVDGASCITIGDTSIAANVWTWVDYRDASTTTKADVTLTAGSHTFKMIGREAGVKLDLLILTADTSCVPTGTGANCVVVADTTPPTVSLTAPTAGQTISGVSNLTANATDAGGISKVEFYVGNALVNTDTTTPYSFALDTTKYPSGSTVIGAKSYDVQGNASTSNSQATVTIGNTVAGQPDLVITSVTQSTVNPVVDSPILFSAVVKNQGTAATTLGVNHGLVFKVDGIVVTWVGVNSDVQIAPGQSLTYTANNGMAGVPYWTATAGNHTVTAIVDDQNLISESNETNNTATTPLAIANPIDTQAPSVPTNVAGTAASSTKVDLTWTASTDNVGVTGYWVARNGVTIAKLGAQTSYSDVNVAPNNGYIYTVAATDAAGNASAFSTSAIVKTPPEPDTQAPSAPVGLTANSVSETQINLAWKASTDNVGVTGYDVFRSTGTNPATKIASVTSTSYGSTGLSASTSYTYYVVARDAAGLQSVNSATATTTTLHIDPAAYGSISGYVQGKYKRHALPGVTIVIYVKNVRYSYSTNSQGMYSIPNLPEGSYTLTFSDNLRRPKPYTAVVKAGLNTVLNVTF